MAAPVFSSIASQAMRYLNIEPTMPVAPAGTNANGVLVQNEHD